MGADGSKESCALVDRIFDAVDADGNGKLDKDEVLRLFAVANNASQVLQKLDADGDGFVQLQELRQFFAGWSTEDLRALGALVTAVPGAHAASGAGKAKARLASELSGEAEPAAKRRSCTTAASAGAGAGDPRDPAKTWDEVVRNALQYIATNADRAKRQFVQQMAQDVLSCYGLAGYAPFLGPYLDTMSQYINMDTVDQLLGVCRPRDGPAEALPRDGTAQVEQLQRDMALGFGRDQVVALLHKVEGYAPSPALKRVVGVAEDFVRAEFMADDLPLLQQILRLVPSIAGEGATAHLQELAGLLMPKVLHYVTQSQGGQQCLLEGLSALASGGLGALAAHFAGGGAASK
uniref:EF-hand domain-containing protein n=1 Tax=Eutreptiella gymnastica TaxID=73025 RepID=A0A7S4LLS4_9EUGL